MRAKSCFALQSCLLLRRNKADVITHFLIKFDRSILLSHFSLSGNFDEYSSHLWFRSITLHCSQALFALMDELL